MGANMSRASKFLFFKEVDKKDTIQLKPDQEHLLTPQLVDHLNDSLCHVNFLLESCDVIVSFKNDTLLDLEDCLNRARGKKEFESRLATMTDQYRKFGFSEKDLQIMAFAKLAYDQRIGINEFTPPPAASSPSSPSSPPKQKKDGEACPVIIPTRRAPSPPVKNAGKETGARPKETLPPIATEDFSMQLDPCDLLQRPPPSWIPEDPPQKKAADTIKRPTIPPPPPPPKEKSTIAAKPAPKPKPRRADLFSPPPSPPPATLQSRAGKMDVDEFIITTVVSSKSPTPPPSPPPPPPPPPPAQDETGSVVKQPPVPPPKPKRL